VEQAEREEGTGRAEVAAHIQPTQDDDDAMPDPSMDGQLG
jgi:hypothetical protein